MKVTLTCDKCGRKPVEIDRVAKVTGHQYTEDVVGYYVMYECGCGDRYWEFKRR